MIFHNCPFPPIDPVPLNPPNVPTTSTLRQTCGRSFRLRCGRVTIAAVKTDPSSNSFPRRWVHWLGPGIIAIVVIVLYSSTLNAPFFFDDLGSIPNNPTIRSLRDWKAVLSPPVQETVAGRPVVNASFAINYAIHGLNIRGYHVANMAIFLASCLALWGVLRRTTARWLRARGGELTAENPTDIDSRAAWFASAVVLVWAVHPLQSETIVYVVQRTELLKTLFYLLTIYAGMRWLHTPSATWLSVAAVSSALGMGCKESMVSAPLFVLVYDYLFVSRAWGAAIKRGWRLYLALAISWLVLLALVANSPRSESAGFGLGVTAIEYLQTQAHVLVHYLKLCFWPSNLTVVYDWPIERNFASAVPAGLLIVSIVGCTIWLLVRRHWLAAPWVMFFFVLAPTSSFIPIVTEVAAERRMHLPLLAAVLTVVALAVGFTRRFISGRRAIETTVALLALTAVPFALATADRLHDYKDEYSIWLSAVRVRPGSQAAANNLGTVYKRMGKYDEAIAEYRRSISISPKYSQPYTGIAAIARERGNIDEAVTEYQRALLCNPKDSFALQNLASIYLDQNESERAKPLIDKLIEIRPQTPGAYVNRGIYLAQNRRFAEAVDAFRTELRFNPDSLDGLHNLGMAYLDLGKPSEAIATFEALFRRIEQARVTSSAESPKSFATSHLTMAEVLLTMNKPAEASRHVKAAIDDPRMNDVAALVSLSERLRAAGLKEDQALVLRKIASIKSAPVSSETLVAAAWKLAALGDRSSAVESMAAAAGTDRESAKLGVRLFHAWLLATNPASGEKEIAHALVLAKDAHERVLRAEETLLKNGHTRPRHNPRFETTLAIAYARAGDFAAAKTWIDRASENLRSLFEGNTTLPESAAQRLNEMSRLALLFEQKKPYIEAENSPSSFGFDPLIEKQFAPTALPPR